MQIGLYDVDSHNYPNLPLMKISAWHKAQGDSVEFIRPLDSLLKHYDKVYVSKVFGDEYEKFEDYNIQADEVVYGGTGFAITIENGKEVYHKDRDPNLPYEIEHIYPDYSLYPELTKNTAYGFLTRGCCNNCGFCIVSKKEGMCSTKVADLSEFWKGQKNIELLDANLLACKDRKELLQQLADSKARVNFTQGLDARFVTEEIAVAITKIKIKMIHFAFDFMKNESQIMKGLKIFKEISGLPDNKLVVYILTNYNTTIEEDLYRVRLIKACGYLPDVRIYRKHTAPQILKDLQRWCNNRFLYRSCDFLDYVPRTGGKTVREIYSDLLSFSN
ncbi:MAG: radical SAM protein [Clostridia bacterium]|nr:radical SAM protein [Clostridia bacterium]